MDLSKSVRPGWDIFERFCYKLSYKSCPNIDGDCLGHFDEHHFLSNKTAVVAFWATFRRIWDTLFQHLVTHCSKWSHGSRVVSTGSKSP